MTASYLINQMPNSILNRVSPFSVLFPDKPAFILCLESLDVFVLFITLVTCQINF